MKHLDGGGPKRKIRQLNKSVRAYDSIGVLQGTKPMLARFISAENQILLHTVRERVNWMVVPSARPARRRVILHIAKAKRGRG